MGKGELGLSARRADTDCRNLWRAQRRSVLNPELHNTGGLQNTERPFTRQSGRSRSGQDELRNWALPHGEGNKKISTPLSDYKTMVEKVVSTWCAVVADELVNEKGDFGTPEK